MTETKNLIAVLKKLLRANGLTYAAIAQQLNLSETSVKRLFSTHNFSLDRIEQICSMMEMDFVDLLRLYDDAQPKLISLSEQQELELVSDIKLLLVAVCVQQSWSYDEIVSRYQISDSECIAYLIKLDRLGLIELLPNNRIRKMVSQQFKWLPNGPIEQFFQTAIQTEFLQSAFQQSGEQRFYLTGSLSSRSIELLNKKLSMLANEFQSLQRDDEKLPVNAKYSCGLMLAFRPWESSVFNALRRES